LTAHPLTATIIPSIFSYDGNGSQKSITVRLPGGAIQQTAYLFGTDPSRGDVLADNRQVIATQYPSKTTGVASSSE